MPRADGFLVSRSCPGQEGMAHWRYVTRLSTFASRSPWCASRTGS
ncbi:MAG: hypothetical protein ACTSU5_02815 [Promethearchaeota archaeon]